MDYDLEWAEMIANANKKLNIQACFFILISSANYNIFEDENILLINKILDLKQHIALHYDNNCNCSVQFCHKILKFLVPKCLDLVSVHNPPSEIKKLKIQNLENIKSVYHKPFFYKETYISDSNLRNNPIEILNKIKSNKKKLPIQLLIHPFNWMSSGNDIKEILNNTFQKKIRIIDRSFRQNKNWNR